MQSFYAAIHRDKKLCSAERSYEEKKMEKHFLA
ncbi:hypothetical protein MANES_04G050266v8 [Manihot esculenta]|uniref:Uncharacterized protein n=1 Tax=Manihot esculenta TaxID=3983 RepID=A0ACB7HUC8_MANES|nr:hypothetical protein MANES_04G050266v8 [Manihot esculenta]